MKKPALLALACSAIAGSAFAQTSSVTLYGVADAAVRQVKNGSAGTVRGVASGANTTSRLGVRGVEQLGGGLSAGFNLESGIELDTGSANASKFWNRRSTVSLMGDFGEVRLGRDTTPTYNNALNDEFGIVGVGSRGVFVYGSSAVLGSGATTAQRTDNGVSYFLPKNLGGWFGQVHVAAGEGVAGNKYTGGRLGYENSQFLVGGAIGQTDVGSGQPKFKNYNLLFNYKSPWGTLHTLLDVKKWGQRKAQELSVGATVPVTQAGSIRVGYTNVNRAGGAAGSGYADADDSTRFALGYVHDLSKRTALYGTYANISNKGAARSSVLYTTPTGMRGGESSSGMEVGMRHSF
ncbi:porin [Pelomonas aquatica]|jgi:predicted porin|uniref:Porin n=1 Tax=Pelomonas aquatica TaxID=431058 RepID=A0A9X4RA32_9BURK|nr:porin [Pelomonas aquatica]MCY4754884.1 porin [Pelomonas aquatica]MDG0865033.1 porin [Pelomonas aquatica]